MSTSKKTNLSNITSKKKVYVYILHSPRLTARSSRVGEIRNILSKYTFQNVNICEISVITNHEPNDISLNVIQQTVNYNAPTEEHVKHFSNYTKTLHVNQLSQMLKHRDALEKTSQQPHEDSWSMIIEDDAIYQEQTMCQSLDNLFGVIHKDKAKLVFLGMPFSSRNVGKQICEVDRQEFPIIPITENYIVHKNIASDMLSHLIPLKYNNNIQYNYVISKMQLTCHQSVHNIMINGSKFGAFTSCTNPCNPLVFNKEYMTIFDMCKKIDQDDVSVESLTDAFNSEMRNIGNLKDNPDFQHIIAKFKIHQGKYEEAKKLLVKALETLEKNHAIINHESWILRDLVRIHKYLQVTSS